MGKVEHGQVVWHELMTPDLAGAKAFYGSLFGWTFNDYNIPGSPPYAMFGESMEKTSGGFCDANMIPGNPPPHWLCYWHVDDVNAIPGQVESLGGKVMVPPTDIPTVGRFTVATDRDGAVFAVITLADLEKYMGLPQGAGTFCWYELHAKDAEKATGFYESLYKWGRQPMDMGPMGTYHIMTRGEQHVAGAMNIPPHENYPSMWLPYIAVDDVDVSAAKASGLGGKILLAPTDIPDVGRFSVVMDPQGAVFALYRPKNPA